MDTELQKIIERVEGEAENTAPHERARNAFIEDMKKNFAERNAHVRKDPVTAFVEALRNSTPVRG